MLTAAQRDETERFDVGEIAQMLLERMDASLLRQVHLVRLAASCADWTDSGVTLHPGAWVTTLAVGHASLKRSETIWIGARHQLWLKVGELGQPFRGSRNTYSFLAFASGRLLLSSSCLRRGIARRYEHAVGALNCADGELSIAIILWNVPTLKGLRVATHLGIDSPLIRSEIARIRNHEDPPAGWSFHDPFGPSEIFRAESDADRGQTCSCVVEEDCGVLRREVDIPLRDDLRLRWEWRVDALPSACAEHAFETFDTLGIAVEFDDRSVIRYIWSSCLPIGFSFPSPCDELREHEVVLVIASGQDRLGQWSIHDRNVASDVRRCMPGSFMRRVTAVYIVASSLLQRGVGKAHFGQIALVSNCKCTSLN